MFTETEHKPDTSAIIMLDKINYIQTHVFYKFPLGILSVP